MTSPLKTVVGLCMFMYVLLILRLLQGFAGIILAAAMYERILSLISIEWENLKINERISLCFQNNF